MKTNLNQTVSTLSTMLVLSLWTVGVLGIVDSGASPLSQPIPSPAIQGTAETLSQGPFRIPFQIPHTKYAIELNINMAKQRLEGREHILLQDIPIPLDRLVIDSAGYSDLELKLNLPNEPLAILGRGTNGLSSPQIMVALPRTVPQGGLISLTIQFNLPFRLENADQENIFKLADWYPRLWWGQNTADDYEVRVKPPAGFTVAASGMLDEKNQVYCATNCRSFGLVFMRGLQMIQRRAGDTIVDCYYEKGAQACAELLLQTAVDVINFYRNWLGFYPHQVLHIVPGGFSFPTGGYPIATAIVGIHGQQQMTNAPISHWRFITAHEVGHQYWMEHVLEAPNAEWLMIGLGIYADRAFMLAKGYGDQHEREMVQRYLQGAQVFLDTRMDRLPEEMAAVDFDYNNIVTHGKGFSVISALACALGKERFESAYRRGLREYQGRPLSVGDFQRLCEASSAENLDWFFEPWVRTSHYLAYALVGQESRTNAGGIMTKVKVRNCGTLRMPIPVTATFTDGSQQCLFTDHLLNECTLVFNSKAPVTAVVLDAQHELPLLVPPPDPKIAQLVQQLRPQITDLKSRIRKLPWTGVGDQALLVFKEAQALPVDDPGISWWKLGLCLYDGKHYDQSMSAFKKASARQPTPYVSVVWQGHLFDILDRREEALACYRTALQNWQSEYNVRHEQYKISIDRAWLQERLKTPFRRSD